MLRGLWCGVGVDAICLLIFGGGEADEVFPRLYPDTGENRSCCLHDTVAAHGDTFHFSHILTS